MESNEIPEPVIRIALFTPGKTVQYNGRFYIVQYNLLRNGELRVKLDGEQQDISADLLEVPLTTFSLMRKV